MGVIGWNGDAGDSLSWFIWVVLLRFQDAGSSRYGGQDR